MIASATSSGSSETVRTSTRHSGVRSPSSQVALIPDMPGIFRSITTMSGRSSPAMRTPDSPSARLAHELQLAVVLR